jgi:hypothetical protein
MIRYIIHRNHTNFASENLIKALIDEKNKIKQQYTFKSQLFSYIRENGIKVSEKSLNTPIKVIHFVNQEKIELDFRSGRYPGTRDPDAKELSSFFKFQVAYYKGPQECLVECVGLESYYLIFGCSIATPKVKSDKKEYAKCLTMKMPLDFSSELHQQLIRSGITQELALNCIKLARDKDERLYMEWVDKIHKFLSLN